MPNIIDFNTAVSGKIATPITPSTHTIRGKYSVGVVCSQNNGKRVTFTSALASKFKLIDEVYVTAYADNGFIVIGATPYNNDSVVYKLSGKDKKIAYASDLVHYIIDAFKLDYSERVSMSFSNIVFNNTPSTPMALVCFSVNARVDGSKSAIAEEITSHAVEEEEGTYEAEVQNLA